MRLCPAVRASWEQKLYSSVFIAKATLGNEDVHCFCNVTLPGKLGLPSPSLCLGSMGRMHCCWPTNGGALALRNGHEKFTAPNLMQKEELARHLSVLNCRTTERPVLSVGWMPVENRNALSLKRLIFF